MVNFSSESLSQVIDRHPLTLSSETSVPEAIAQMSQTQASCVLIEEDGQLVGLFAEQNVVRVAAEGKIRPDVAIAAVMDRQAIALKESEAQNPIAVLSALQQHQICHLPILEDSIQPQQSAEADRENVSPSPPLIRQVVGLVSLMNLVQVPKSTAREDNSSSSQSFSPSPLLSCFIEIAQSKRTEEILRQREQEFRALAENSPDIIARLDRELRHVYVNPAVELASGMPPGEFLGKTTRDLDMPEAIVTFWDQAFRKSFQTGEDSEIEFSLLTATGLRYYQSRLVPEFAADGSVQSVLAISRDVTTNKQTEEALRESEQRFRRVFESAPVGIALVNSQRRIFQSNQIFQDILGYSEEELQNLSIMEITYPDDRAESLKLSEELLRGKHSRFNLEKQYFRKDGRIVWCSVSLSAIYDANGVFQYAIAMLQDISNRKQAESELQNARDELENRVLERTAELANANTLLKQEITERQQAQEALNAQKEFLQTVIDTNPSLIWVKDTENKVILANQAVADFFGITVEDLIGKTNFDLNANPADAEYCIAQDWEVLSTLEEMFISEESFPCATGEVRWFQTIKKPLFSRNGQVYQTLGVGTDITERKQAQEALNASHEFLQTVLDTNPNKIFVKDTSGKYVLVNQACANFWGMSVADMLGKTDIELNVNPTNAEQFIGHDREVLATLQEQFFPEVACRNSTGDIRWFQTIKKPLFSSEGQVNQVFGVCADITERKLLTEELKAQKEFLQTVIDINPNLIFVKDRESKYVLVNQAFADFYGQAVEDFLGKVDADFNLYQAEWEQYVAQDREVLTTLQQKFIPEEACHTPIGELRWLQTIKKPLFSGDGQVCQMLGVSIDITARKRAEEQLRHSEAQLRIALDAARLGFWDWNFQTGNVTRSNNLKQMFGWTPDTADSKESFLAILHPDDRDRVRKANKHALQTGEGRDIEFRIIWPDGTIRWIESKGQAIYDETGKPVQISGVALDITERKQAEEQLRQSEAQLQLALEAARMGLWDWNLQTEKFTASNHLKQLYGLASDTCEETRETFLTLVHPEDRAFMERGRQRFLETGEYDNNIDFRIIRPDGKIFWIESKLQVFYDETGKPLRAIGIDMDITERKQAQLALIAQKDFLQTVLDTNPNMIFVKDREGKFVLVNQAFAGSLGMAKEEILGLTDADLNLNPVDVERYIAQDREIFATLQSLFILEETGQELTGKRHWVQLIKTPIVSSDGQVSQILGVATDITNHKLAEEKLRQSDVQLHLALEAAHMGFWDCNLQAGTTSWSNSLEQLYGLAPNTYDGTYESFLARVHPEDCDLVREVNQRATDTGEDSCVEFRIVLPDGTIRWIESKGHVFHDEMGQPVRMTGINIDISDRKQAETQIKASLREKEVLLQEVHHRVKNNLQVISSLLDLQSQYIQEPAMLEMFRESRNRVKSMALVHEKLYQSQDCAKINFPEYVESLTSDLFQAYTVNADRIALELDIDEVTLNIEAAIPCGLIINELVSNALKHAFPNHTNGTVRVALQSDFNKTLTLSIRDSGIGFPNYLDFKRVQSLGLQLVNVLTSQLEGTLELDRNAGTEFRITFRN